MSMKNYPAKLTTGYYRVRETWEDAASQLGAYRLLTNAIAKADENPGTFVFSNEGVRIYPEEAPVEDETGEETGEEIPDDPADETKDTPTGETGNETGSGSESKAGDSTGSETGDGGAEGSGENQTDTPNPPPSEDFPTATEYENDGNEKTIAYAKLKTLMNIRAGDSLEAEILATCRKDTVLEILQFCENGWLRVRCTQAGTGFAYVSNEDGQYAYTGPGLYTVRRGDNLWMIAENELGDGTRYTQIRELNGLTSNATRVGMPLIMPEK